MVQIIYLHPHNTNWAFHQLHNDQLHKKTTLYRGRTPASAINLSLSNLHREFAQVFAKLHDIFEFEQEPRIDVGQLVDSFHSISLLERLQWIEWMMEWMHE